MKIRITFDLTDEQREAISYECDGGCDDRGYVIYKADYETCRDSIKAAVDTDLDEIVNELMVYRKYTKGE